MTMDTAAAELPSSKPAFLGRPMNACLASLVSAAFLSKIGEADFGNSA